MSVRSARRLCTSDQTVIPLHVRAEVEFEQPRSNESEGRNDNVADDHVEDQGDDNGDDDAFLVPAQRMIPAARVVL